MNRRLLIDGFCGDGTFDWSAALKVTPQPTGSEADSLPVFRHGMSSWVSSHRRWVLKIGVAIVAEMDT